MTFKVSESTSLRWSFFLLQLSFMRKHLNTQGAGERRLHASDLPHVAAEHEKSLVACGALPSFTAQFQQGEIGSFMQQQHSKPLRYDQSDCPLNPGETVEQSGIYEICHSDEPRTTLLLLRNSFFPYCRKCGDSVRFKLIHAAPHISEDPDFSEAVPEPDNSLLNKATPTSLFPMQLGTAHGFRFVQEVAPAWGAGSENGDL